MGMAAHGKMGNLRNRVVRCDRKRCWIGFPSGVVTTGKPIVQPNFPLRVFIDNREPEIRRIREATDWRTRCIEMTTVRTLLPWALLLTVSGTALGLQTSTPPPAKHPKAATHHPAHAKTAQPKSHVRHVKTRRKPRSAKSI